MYLVMYADKGRYDRRIDIHLCDTFSTAEMADKELRKILLSWLISEEPTDNELFDKCDYDRHLYNEKIGVKIKSRITKAINKEDTIIMYDSYDGFNISSKDGYLTMITTGCPSDNEYCGETYQVIYI